MKALVDSHLKQIISEGLVSHMSSDIDLREYIQPASIDLPIGDSVYLVKHKFLPFESDVFASMKDYCVTKFDAQDGVVLYKGQTYLIPCLKVHLSDDIFWKVSPKSSIGRIDVLVRTVFDNIWLYDTIKAWSEGELWLEVTPQSFNIKVFKGISLSQIMFFDMTDYWGILIYDPQTILLDVDNNQPLSNPMFCGEDMVVSLWLMSDVIGYIALNTNYIIDLSQVNSLDYHDFFRELFCLPWHWVPRISLDQWKFYILMTKEIIQVPQEYSIELVPFSHLLWEVRVHYAWFLDPWFCSTCVLEMRPHDDLMIYHGQPICLVHVYHNKWVPEKLYGSCNNNYQCQKW